MYKATLTKEISVETPNQVGVAAKLTQLIAGQAKANIRSAWAAGTNDHGHFSLITDNNQKAIEAIKGEFPKLKENEVLVFLVKDHLGDLAGITSEISKADLDINFLYTTHLDNQPALVLSTSDNKKAQTLFNS